MSIFIYCFITFFCADTKRKRNIFKKTIYKKCTNKSACGIISNLCIKVNQSVESIPNLNNHVVCYSRNTATTSGDDSQEEIVKINSGQYNQPIG